jgi:hypothetical protein
MSGARPPQPSDRGSTLPLILGFVVLALLMVAGSVIASEAFVQQRDLQATCDGAAVAAAASAADLGGERADGGEPAAGDGESLAFAGVQAAVQSYLDRDPDRQAIDIHSVLAADARTITLTCVEVRPIAFGAVFGHADGIRHTATSSARAPVTAAR